VEVWIDGVLNTTFSEYGSVLAWQQSWTPPTPLGAGTHTVQFKNLNASAATYIDIDAITIFEPDLTPPAAITNLAAVPGANVGEVSLNWSAVGDDGTNGTASSYLVRYSSSPITSETAWNNATAFANSLTPKAAGGSESLTATGLFSPTPYYFAVRAQDEQQNLGGLSNSPSSTAKQPTPVGPGTYDDADPAWSYTGSWTAYSGAGPYVNTMHYTNVQNAAASITFTGTGFTVYFTKYPNRGDVEVWIDGVLNTTLSEYGSALAWQQTWTLPTALSNGTHTVQFKNPNPSTATYIDIDAIQITGPVVPVGPGTYDDANPAWSYTGSWIAYSGAGPYANTMHYTNAQNASASVTFTGSQFKLWFTRYPNRGDVEVWIDGVLNTTFSEYGSVLAWQQSWTPPTALSNGTHTVQFKNPNLSTATYIDIDAIQILSAASNPTQTASSTSDPTQIPTSAQTATSTSTPTQAPTFTQTATSTSSPTPTPTTTSTASSPDVVLVGAGDISTCSNNNDEATAKLLDGIPGTVFAAGDNAYENGTISEYTNCYDPTWGRSKARTKPVPGNHEYQTSGAAGYYQYFNNPPEYYAYDLGAWRIYALNSEIDVSASGPQSTWLQADLRSNPHQCVLAYWHKPRWSSGSTHGSTSSMQAIWQIMYNAGAEVVISGHEHNYERFAEMNASGSAVSAGLREFVVGTGGRGLYPFGSPLSGSQVRDNSSYGVLKLTLRPGAYDWQFVPVTGSTFTDSGTGSCH
jgi:hypothetical protein